MDNLDQNFHKELGQFPRDYLSCKIPSRGPGAVDYLLIEANSYTRIGRFIRPFKVFKVIHLICIIKNTKV